MNELNSYFWLKNVFDELSFNNLPHGIIINGPQGIGKRVLAYQIAYFPHIFAGRRGTRSANNRNFESINVEGLVDTLRQSDKKVIHFQGLTCITFLSLCSLEIVYCGLSGITFFKKKQPKSLKFTKKSKKIEKNYLRSTNTGRI